VLLSNLQIKRAVADGSLVCVPYEEKHVSEASLDLTLGYYYYKTEKTGSKTIYNPFDHEDVERYFDGPYTAIPHDEWCKKNGYALFKNIPEKHPIIVLKPGERILAHTHEFVGIQPPCAWDLKSRSSWARNGVAVCFDAGWIDPGYINRVTLEIFNLNMHESIVLPVGERICQGVFHTAGEMEGSYGSGHRDGLSDKYQQGSDIESIIRTWTPDMMLPRSYKDVRVMPAKIDGVSL
jgi:deoxycytidine triphosphate deaminase